MKRGALIIVPEDFDLHKSRLEIFCHENKILGKNFCPIGHADSHFNINATFQSFRIKTYQKQIYFIRAAYFPNISFYTELMHNALTLVQQ